MRQGDADMKKSILTGTKSRVRAFPCMIQNTTRRLSILALVSAAALAGCQSSTALPAVLEVQKATSETPSRLVLNVKGYEVETGRIMVALYADRDAFDNETAPLRDAKVDITGPETNIVFEDLPVGEYAFKLYHDANGNGELDTNGFGIPSEDYFFSTGASDPFSAPEFEESKFVLPVGKMIRNVDLS